MNLKTLKEEIAHLRENDDLPFEEKQLAPLLAYMETLGDNDEKQLTQQEEINIFKLIVLNVHSSDSMGQLKNLFDRFNLKDKILPLFKYQFRKLPDPYFLALEKMQLLTLENAASTSQVLEIINFAAENNIKITQADLDALKENKTLQKFIIDEIDVFQETLKEKESKNPDARDRLRHLTIENIKLAIAHKNMVTQIQNFIRVYRSKNSLFDLKLDEDNPDSMFEALAEREEFTLAQICRFIPDYQTRVNQEMEETKLIHSALPKKLILDYLFFSPKRESYIPPDNVVAEHFRLDTEEHQAEVKEFFANAENTGQGMVQVVQYALVSLGVPKEKMLGFICGYAHSAFETLATAWPEHIPEEVQYLFTIIPSRMVGGVPQHATAFLFDLKIPTIEYIDSYGPQGDIFFQNVIGSIMQFASKSSELKVEDLDNEDLDDDELEDKQTLIIQHKKMTQLAKILVNFFPISPPDHAPVQQVDQFSCVTQAGGNLLGAVLKKENKIPDEKCDPKTRAFIKDLLLDIQTGEGIRLRTPQMIMNIAGVLCIAASKLQHDLGMTIKKR